MPRFSVLVAPLLLSLLPLGCTGTETGNPEVAQVSLSLISQQPGHISVGDSSFDTASELLVSSGQLRVDSLTLLPCLSSDLPSTLSFEVKSLGSRRIAEVPVGDYCGLSLERHDGSAPSLELRATVPETQQLVEFQVIAQQELVLTYDLPFTIEKDSRLIIGIDLAYAISEGSLSELIPNQQGETVLVDETNNWWLAEEISNQLPGAMGLYVDENGDGILQPGELELSLF